MKLIRQDDCAPDSFKSFSVDFQNVTGMTVAQFKKEAFTIPLQDGFKWSLNGYILEWWCDDPFYVLYDPIRPRFDKPADVIDIGEYYARIRI